MKLDSLPVLMVEFEGFHLMNATRTHAMLVPLASMFREIDRDVAVARELEWCAALYVSECGP